jgi:hypothetical protein
VSWLPVGTLLGDLQLSEVFVEYDGPRLFVCRSLTDQQYLVGWAEEAVGFDRWLYVPVSEARLTAVRSGLMPLIEAYTHPEGFIYLATLHHNDTSEDLVRPLKPTELDDSWLPDSDVRLNLSTPTAPPAHSPEELERLAKQEWRTRLDLRVHLPEYYRTEAPTKAIGAILLALQGTLENLGALELYEEPAQSGSLPDDATRAMASNIVALSAASFVIGIAPTDSEDLFGESTFASAVSRLVGLAGDPVEEATVASDVAALRPRAARSYRRLIKELSSTNGDVSITAGSPSFGNKSARLDAEALRRLSDILDATVPEEPSEIRGRMVLIGGQTEKGRFVLRDVENDSVFEGAVSKAAQHQMQRATLGDAYDVLLSELALSEGATGGRKLTYVLEQLVHVDEPEPSESVERTETTDPDRMN